MKRAVLVGLMLLGMGCSEKPGEPTGAGASAFKSEDEERAYLSALQNPTLEQFRRKNELAERKKREDARLDREWEEMSAQQDLDKAKEIEGAFVEGSLKGVRLYADLIDRYPHTPQARVAAQRINELKEAAAKKSGK